MTETSPEGQSPRRRRSLEAQADFMLARLIERMEKEGVISKPNHKGLREVLLPEDRE